MNIVQTVKVQRKCAMNHRVTSQSEILEKALDIAKKEGVDKVSIRKLSNACGIAIGSIYNYYPNKESLIVAVSEHFWGQLLADQEQLFRAGIGFTAFLEQYYMFLYGRLAKYDSSWLGAMDAGTRRLAVGLFRKVLDGDGKVDHSIWNMELNQDAFCEYVLTNITALLQAGENNCRFFTFLLEHLLYHV